MIQFFLLKHVFHVLKNWFNIPYISFNFFKLSVCLLLHYLQISIHSLF
ncbi:MAG: hypothetical protein Q27BB25_18890 [Blastomonas sp. CACIA14H2]|nr:MAG: hypothetical protein Q27BB25_18890 [Blastomonas sp. CACIA14H2]